ncbi:uncharacterized protein LOC103713095 [Phoenix dactylifera]|uniref:Uncharacterized protein LOC103713095 n=1 Tax=Phoenix dactylifera TaxID=42345 RepID=A0A8B9ANZ6_PHODC|nr:uncharacterized protein LOC103713095 [Phoenix dactylifera]
MGESKTVHAALVTYVFHYLPPHPLPSLRHPTMDSIFAGDAWCGSHSLYFSWVHSLHSLYLWLDFSTYTSTMTVIDKTRIPQNKWEVFGLGKSSIKVFYPLRDSVFNINYLAYFCSIVWCSSDFLC